MGTKRRNQSNSLLANTVVENQSSTGFNLCAFGVAIDFDFRRPYINQTRTG
jgi:hypothetical protein